MKFCAVFLSLFFFISCTNKGCPKNSERNQANNTQKTWDSPSDFPMLNFSGLSNKKHTENLIRIFNDEVCPCGCPASFAACLTTKHGSCKPSLLLAEWAINQLKAGHPERFVFQGLTEEINAGFLVPPVIIDLSGAYRKGNEYAAITIIEYADFLCSSCKRASRVLDNFLKKHSDIVKIYFLHAPLSLDSEAELAAIASEAAGLQGKFWAMHDALYAHDGSLSKPTIFLIAQPLFSEREFAQFKLDITRPELKEKIRRQREFALKNCHIFSTPSLFINGRPYTLTLDEEGLSLRIAMEQARSTIKCQD